MNAPLNLPNCMSGSEPTVLSKIYQPEINMVEWQRQLNAAVCSYTGYIAEQESFINLSTIINCEEVPQWLADRLPNHPDRQAFIDDVTLLADMFSCLFELPELAIRIQCLKQAMCPRFHVDRVPSRLVTTYQGAGTEWLENRFVDRSKLGRGSEGKPDESSGLIDASAKVSSVNPGSVVLLKGEGWWENEGRGVVHRSPQASAESPRIFLSFDFAN